MRSAAELILRTRCFFWGGAGGGGSSKAEVAAPGTAPGTVEDEGTQPYAQPRPRHQAHSAHQQGTG
jgi:hypothetical protein